MTTTRPHDNYQTSCPSNRHYTLDLSDAQRQEREHRKTGPDTLARKRVGTDVRDLLFRLQESNDEGALPNTVGATDEPVVPCELLLESGPHSHGLGRQVLVNPFHICGAEEAHVMHVWMSRIGRLRLSNSALSTGALAHSPAARTLHNATTAWSEEAKKGSAKHSQGTRHHSKACSCASREIALRTSPRLGSLLGVRPYARAFSVQSILPTCTTTSAWAVKIHGARSNMCGVFVTGFKYLKFVC